MAKSKKALGRGIGAILEDVERAYIEDIEDKSRLVQEIEIDSIVPNIFQPRKHFNQDSLKELSESIKKYGLLQPIIVIKKDNGYMLIAGERRLRAAKLANFDTIKAIVADIESKNLRELALIENIQREDLNPIELANAYRELIDQYKITHDELSKIIHKSRTQITNTLRLLNLNDRTKRLISEGKISQGHAKVLVGLDKKEEDSVVNSIIGQKLSVRETEKIIKQIKKREANSGKKESRIDPNIIKKIDAISKELLEVGINSKRDLNRLIVEFKNYKEVEIFLDRFKK